MTNFPTDTGSRHRVARRRPSVVGWPVAAVFAVVSVLSAMLLPSASGVADFGDVEANRFYTDSV